MVVRVGCSEKAGLSFWCGRTKTEVFEYNDVINHTAHALYGMLSFFRSIVLAFPFGRAKMIFRKRKNISVF